MNVEQILPLPPAGKYGFFTGAMVGLVAWIVGNPIFGAMLENYQKGDVAGKIVGSILMGVFTFFLTKKYGYTLVANQNRIFQVFWSVFIAFITYMVIHYGGFSLVFKELADSYFQKSIDNTWAFSYMIAFGFLGLVVGSFIEAVNNLSNNPSA